MKIKMPALKILRQNLSLPSSFRRYKSGIGLWHQDINTDIKISIEKHWANEACPRNSLDSSKKPFYVLPMFPYPSGSLHMGHVRVYSISDTIARFQKLMGKNVIHPIGWDAFGLPAENAAIERNIQPQNWTHANIDSMKEQLLKLSFDFDWSREVSTCDPEYYRWTQYIFLKLFEKGLAYQSEATVNWDPVDKTVLADEQVDDLGCSWRSGAKVEKKILTQWFIKTTKFAKQLYDGLDSEELDNWGDIINLQKHWIGICNGVVVTFPLEGNNKVTIDVWTSQPAKFIHGQFVTVTRTHVILQGLTDDEAIRLKCINPLTGCELPVHVTDDAPYPEGRDIYIACPSLDPEDEALARRLGITPDRTKQNIDLESENQKAIDVAKEKDVGGHFVSSKLKDWLISRQRYWGTPIPIIHCPNCGTVPVPYKDLPVKLPDNQSKEGGIQTLSNFSEWVNCKCPRCSHVAKRETDTMDTFVDSSWYFYRFLDPHNEKMPFSKEPLENTTPVHIYIGGKEHAVLHLYYARFMSYFLHSLGWTPHGEPFKKLVAQGMVMGQSYKIKSSGKYIPSDCVEKVGKQYKEKETGEPVVVQWEKMSKSKHNGENPERLLTTYGCDLTRLLMLADVPPATPRQWSDATLPGVLNWQHRLWLTIRDFLKCRQEFYHGNNTLSEEEFRNIEDKLADSRNHFTATATYHFQHTHKLSVGISRLQGLTSVLRNKLPPEVIAKSKEFELSLAALIIMMSPVTPHFCLELWAGFLSAPNRVCQSTPLIDWESNVHGQKWPVVDPDCNLSFLCKVDGADRCDLKVKASDLATMSEDQALEMMVNQDAIARRIKRGLLKTRYELYPGCRAILHLYTNRPPPKKIEVAETD